MGSGALKNYRPLSGSGGGTSNHAALSGLQGGIPSERFHADKAMHDLLYNQAHPFTNPGVSLVVNQNDSNIIREIGTRISFALTLNGYRGTNQVKKLLLQKNGVDMAPATILNPAQDNGSIVQNIVDLAGDALYTGVVSDTDNKSVSAAKQYLFRHPILAGVSAKDIADIDLYQDLGKLTNGNGLLDKQTITLANLTFSNQFLYLAVPSSYGFITRIDDGATDIYFQPGSAVAVFEGSPHTKNATSVGLTANWTLPYRVYKTKLKTTANSSLFRFLF